VFAASKAQSKIKSDGRMINVQMPISIRKHGGWGVVLASIGP
jgi:hypothetical protein